LDGLRRETSGAGREAAGRYECADAANASQLNNTTRVRSARALTRRGCAAPPDVDRRSVGGAIGVSDRRSLLIREIRVIRG